MTPQQRYKKNNKEKVLAQAKMYSAQYRLGHPATEEQKQQACARTKAWRLANPGKRKRQARDKENMAWHRRRARKLRAFVENVDRFVVLSLANGLCGICGFAVDPTDFEVDHIIPLACGGQHSYANTQPAHPLCNRGKGARILT